MTQRNRTGFTIVELLIVVVVIAILAAITIVAYNGIQNRAKESAALSATEQAAKKILTYAITNADLYPDSIASAGLSEGGSTYQYRVDNNVEPKNFCLTATTNGLSYFVSNANPNPTAGACNGHGANGATVISNLIPNPSVETDTLHWNSNWGTGATGTATRFGVGGWSNHGYFRMAWTTAPTVNWGGLAHYYVIPVEAGKTYRLSAYVRTSVAQSIRIYARPNTYPSPGDIQAQTLTTVPNAWTRFSGTVAIPAGVTGISVRIDRITATGTWLPGNTLDISSIMVTEGSEDYPYLDGNSPGWIWNGTRNSSTSTGPTT